MFLHLTTRTLIGALLCCVVLYGQLPDEAKKAADTWLVKNCDEGDKQSLEPVLEKYKTQLEPYFIQALQKGPDTQQIAAEQAAAAQQFQRLQETLKRGKAAGLRDADMQAGLAVTSQQYLARQKDEFILRYRSQAAAGLGIVDGESGKAALRALVQDAASPLQSSAQAALDRLGVTLPRQNYKKK
jgi:hypothetical protein